ncbi:hypothetical protein QYF36_009769 [Acer negundo]|nr:hypothetical protein QYF36_009769 [Acer negundo]
MFLSCSAKQLMEQTNEDGIGVALPNPYEYLVRVKANAYKIHGHKINKLNIVAIHRTVNEETIKPENEKGKNVIE